MKLKIALSTATAMGLAMGMAWAGSNNEAYISQQGAFNSADIDQAAGSNNDAGSAGQTIIQRRASAAAQASDTNNYNALTIEQSGQDNSIGLGSNVSAFGHATGVYQDENYVGNSNTPAQRNLIDITQSSDDNTVGAVSQYTATHGGDNSLTITQGGAGNNTVGGVAQSRSNSTSNTTVIEQTGDHNTIARVDQWTDQYGGFAVTVKNDLNVKMSGTNNGNGALTGFAQASGAQSSTLIQGGPGRSASSSYAHLDISGNGNQFGVTQYGDMNSVGLLTISGSSNEVGTYQRGNSNIVALAAVTGSTNNIGIRQIGNSNLATVGVTGDDNDIGVDQADDSTATVTITGGTNLLAVNQANGATATVTIWGSNNNRTGFSGAITSSLAATNSTLGVPMQAGGITQDGASSITLDVGLLGGVSDGNVFALNQDGAGNSIVGTIKGGNNNEAVVTQVGASNVTTFSQIGGANLVAIAQ